MNTDIRLSVGFLQHPKTRKTKKRLGFEGVESLLNLWLWVAVNRPDGVLYGMNSEDIELAADWQGEENTFFDFCLSDDKSSMWIDVNKEGVYVLHDWSEHNPWQAEADTRSDSARFANLARYNKPMYEVLKKQGVKGLTKEEFEHYRSETISTEVSKDTSPTPTDAAKESYRSPTGVVENPKPTRPSPSPSPKPEENKNTKHTHSATIPRARDYTNGSLGTSCEEGALREQDAGLGLQESSSQQKALPKKTDCPSKGNPEWTSFLSCYDVYPVKQGQEDAWREWIRLKNNGVLEPAWIIRDAILDLSANDSRWLEGMVPRMAKWLSGKGWNDKPYVKPNTSKKQKEEYISPSKTPEQLAKERTEAEKMLVAIRQRSRQENKSLLGH